MLLINNNRSKSYLQNLILYGFVPKKIILLNYQSVELPEHTENDKVISAETNQKFIRSLKCLDMSFDEKEHILTTIKNTKIDYVIVESIEVNSVEVISEVKRIPTNYIVYSGPGGSLLKKEVLSQGKRFIHVHPGWLPDYRGSTTLYYSMLINLEVGASVIFLEEGIDEGPVLYKDKFNITDKNIDFDYVLDPLVRTRVLVDFFGQGKLDLSWQNPLGESNTFYIVHPFVKHASIRKKLHHDKD